MRAHEERAADQLRRDRDRLTQLGVELRHAAVQGSYAGWRGQDVGFCLAALVDSVMRSLDQMPTPVRRDALAAAAAVLDGPDGPDGPRARPGGALTNGPGH
ncbi:MAG: hypothetical protein L0I76_17730 [Pseudonocardia sp.]|nr:hypothetical protein [Pseudonocardia sp.]